MSTDTLTRAEKWARLRSLIDQIGTAALVPDIHTNGVHGVHVNVEGIGDDVHEAADLSREMEREEVQRCQG